MRRFWTQKELDTVRRLYPHRRTVEIAKLLKRPLSSVYQAAANLDVHKTKAFLESPEAGIFIKGHQRGKATQFGKGHVPANKGLRRPGYGPGRMKETQFKKGQLSGRAKLNFKPIGTILTDTEGYQRIKVRHAVHGKEPTGFGNVKVWPLLNRYVWEQAKGPIPPKHTICFKDGDRSNCKLENLELVSRADLAKRNNMWRSKKLPLELRQAIALKGAIKRKITLFKKEKRDGKK